VCFSHDSHQQNSENSRKPKTPLPHVDLLPFIRPGGKTVGMHESSSLRDPQTLSLTSVSGWWEKSRIPKRARGEELEERKRIGHQPLSKSGSLLVSSDAHGRRGRWDNSTLLSNATGRFKSRITNYCMLHYSRPKTIH
jgi:hypothetical protein